MTSLANSAALREELATPRWAAARPLALLMAGGGAVGLSRWLVRPPLPDDYDSINFLFGISRQYDLALFQPQFPGYPVFIAAGTALHHLGLSALAAAELVSAVASGLTAVALGLLAWRLGGKGAAVAAMLLQPFAWLPWLLGSGALSDATGVALVAAAFALFAGLPGEGDREARSWPLAAGVALGLGLGVRASYWPFAVALAVAVFRGDAPRWKPALGFAAGLAAWGVPFVSVVGARRLAELGRTHLVGHFEQWGGSVVTRPDPLLRLGACARALFYDGLAPWWPAALGLALVVGVAVALTPAGKRWRPAWTRAALMLVPYAAWAFLAQNVVEQPRHLLPLVEGELLILACLLGAQRWAAVVASLLMAVASVPLARERREVPPAAAQAVAWIRAHPVAEGKLSWVVGTRSSRFFQELAPEIELHESQWLSLLTARLARVDRMPDRILLTSEVDLHSGLGERSPLPIHWRVEPVGPSFCRDARIDRGQPCLQLSQLSWVP
ncbi:MAG TPA: hypothetical protein VMB91_02440 [Solirubrobacteraceae bacterium]|nr:hypothetical protein [Solirubrobacteraceae bacterium]